MTFTALAGPSPALNQYPPPSGGARPPTAIATSLLTGLDSVNGGKYRITGTTKRKGTPDAPARVRVSLFDQVSKVVIREMWSDAITGVYAFERIRLGTFFVVSFDHTGAFNAVIADAIVSELMP